jgi:hypothetical protein
LQFTALSCPTGFSSYRIRKVLAGLSYHLAAEENVAGADALIPRDSEMKLINIA